MGRIAVVDAGAGNLRSVARALQVSAPEADVRICDDAAGIIAADRVVLPGQGAIRDCMAQLERSGLLDAVLAAARSKPLLGVCVGEQMLFTHSDEDGGIPGLGLFPGGVRRFAGAGFDGADPAAHLKVPHMGWNGVRQSRPHPLWEGIADGARFYFVHSYHVVPEDSALTVGETDYGSTFTSAVAADNIFATQFHPEKSAAAGLRLYRNFVHWNP